MTTSQKARFSQPLRLFNPDTWGYVLFWAWNLIFLAFMGLGFAPQILPNMVNAVKMSQVPAEFLILALLITLVPLAAVVLGATVLQRAPRKLLALGYGVEGPLLLLLLLRFLVVRQATPAVSAMLVMAVLGVLTLLWHLLDRRIDQRGALPALLRLIGASLMLLAGLYAAAWILFYALPVAATILDTFGSFLRGIGALLSELWRNLTDPTWWRVLLRDAAFLPFSIFGFLLLGFSATLFVGMPLAIVLIYTRTWLAALRAAATRLGQPLAAGIAVTVVAGGLVLVTWLDQQPQADAFALLQAPPTSPAEAQQLLDQQDTLRVGLLNAYLASNRYMSAVGDVQHIRDMYEGTVGMSRANAEQVQNAYEHLTRPLLYRPVEPNTNPTNWENQAFRREPREAATLYEQFFDQSIVDGEHDTVVRAVRSTWNVEQSLSAWQAVDDREVHLLTQAVTVTPAGDWADVELYEVYQNITGVRQEVVYYFNLPESAVITGLWLGPNADRDQRFAFRISPRGAAQATYRNELRRQVDPALIEQVGPRQYRLRAFPVEPQRLDWENSNGLGPSTITPGAPLHLWLTYRVLVQDNAWPLPQLAEKVNVYWDETTMRTLNGAPMSFGDADPAETWLPVSVPAAGEVVPQIHTVDFPGGQTVIVRPVNATETSGLAGELRLAVVLDRSRSMADQQAAVQASFERLQALTASGAQVDVYLTASPYRGEQPSLVRLADFDPAAVLYFGGQNAAELLAQYAALRGDRSYDAVLVLTDSSGYGVGETDVPVTASPAPIWLIHLGGFPMGYDDPTLDAVQASGGGAAATVDEALGRLAAHLTGAADGVTSDVVDGYQWLTLPTEQARTLSSVPPAAADDAAQFAPFAARRLILAEMQQRRGEMNDLTLLDRLHALAGNYGLVTPLSSMIVLVNTQQQQLLDKLEQQDDRFQREHEDVGETVGTPPVAGVPEPEEWLLLALAAAMLGWYVRSNRRAAARQLA